MMGPCLSGKAKSVQAARTDGMPSRNAIIHRQRSVKTTDPPTRKTTEYPGQDWGASRAVEDGVHGQQHDQDQQ